MSQSIFPAPEIVRIRPGRVLIATSYGKAPLFTTLEGYPVHVLFTGNNTKSEFYRSSTWLIEADEDPTHVALAPVFTLASHIDSDSLPVQVYLAETPEDDAGPRLTTTTDKKAAIKLNFIPETSSESQDHPKRYYVGVRLEVDIQRLELKDSDEGTELLLTVVPPAEPSDLDNGSYGHVELQPLAGNENAQLWDVDSVLLH
ncbi:hypothetical protein EXIGLDRAFT_703653 [Exidia glandulosa HHB12029]|uniref:Uncharacterized protein n=1 Tax=Exidia glandulosa HHB12029 TaxID=1314781 RepID=A0A165Q1B2_EXIGL|nr:hypothetical protein EXIGLDRAFT_703653 [Exidia glandulosa HHB12029]